MAYLILIRHGKSEWNKLGLWTGHSDVHLAPEGIEEARNAGEMLKDREIHLAHTSMLTRTHQTLQEIANAIGKHIETHAHPALNERHYGIHTGKNKWQVKEEVGEAMFQAIRRGWDVPIPEGETLKDVHARVLPYYKEYIEPKLKDDKNVLIVAHGNTLRALIKHLENKNEKEIEDVEVGTGEIHCYQIGKEGNVIDKEIRAVNDNKKSV
jgi:2,3-bisphosphoglycerate-dependent phosphoglycerate mutase